MTPRLYSYVKDPYLQRLQATVSDRSEQNGRPFLILNDTIFYPEGGGQPADHGRIADVAVIDVQKSEQGILHFLDTAPSSSLDPGERVEIAIDWNRRFDHMQQHSAQHLLTAIADKTFGWNTTSFHLGAELCDIELDTHSISKEQIEILEDEIASAIRQDITFSSRQIEPTALAKSTIRSRGLPAGHQGLVRIVEINGIDQCACGGTHIRTSCELEALKILDTEPIRGGTRLFWLAGARVRQRLQQHEERNRLLREILQTSDEDLADVARIKIDQQKEGRKRIESLEKRWAEAVAEALAGRPGPWIEAHFEETSSAVIGQISRAVLERNPDLAVFLTASDTKGSSFVIAAGRSSTADVPGTGKAVAETLEGRGGGKGSSYQGRAGSLLRREAAVEQLR